MSIDIKYRENVSPSRCVPTVLSVGVGMCTPVRGSFIRFHVVFYHLAKTSFFFF